MRFCPFLRLSLSPFFVRPVHTSHFASVCEFALKATRFERASEEMANLTKAAAEQRAHTKGFWLDQSKKMLAHTIDSTLEKEILRRFCF